MRKRRVFFSAKDSGLKHERGQFDQFDIADDFKVDPTNLWAI